MIEYRVRCSNGFFCGDVTMYANHDDLRKAADILNGFPLDRGDSRALELGTFQPHTAGGGIQAEFYCVDSVGHAIVSVKLRDDACKSMGEAQSVCLQIPVEAGAIDSFVSQARSIVCATGKNAHLQMADHTADWVRRYFERAAARK
ncbi:MAG: hypothetical protein WA414_16290 [Acidobacteriaceae bacterium]